MSERMDWPALMRAGLFELRLDPERFWRMTPAELRVLLGDRSDQRPMLREGLDALMAAWPDDKKGEPDEGI